MATPARPLVACLLVGLLVGCGPDLPDDPGRKAVLLVNPHVDRSYMAEVDGILRRNERGCYAIDDQVLLAPYGSRESDDGRGVVFPGYGEVRIGERIVGAGGTLSTIPPGGRSCSVDNPEADQFVSLDPRK